MGKQLIQQRRGRGTKAFTSPSFRFQGEVKYPSFTKEGVVGDIVHCSGHSAPLMEVVYENGERTLAFAPEGIACGDTVGSDNVAQRGNIFPLRVIPEGTLVQNIELKPGDGGKLVRASGVFAKIISKSGNLVKLSLPSRKEKDILADCRATIGVLAGSGRLEKPFLKAGTRDRKMRARNKFYPKVCGVSMNAVAHPFGGKCSHQKGRPTQAPRDAPPGRKVGKIAPRRTGRKR